MKPLSLEQFCTGKFKTKLPIIEIFIHKALDEQTFVISDATKTCHLTIKKNPALGKNIKTRGFVRCINAKCDDGGNMVILQQDTRVFPCHPVAYKELDQDEEELGESAFATFDDICKQKNGTNVTTLVAKILFQSPTKKSGYSGSSRVAKVTFNACYYIFFSF